MGGSSGGGVIPFNMNALKAVMPSVFQGPYNAQGALQNEQMIAKKFPWITPPAGQFAGAQPGQSSGAGGGGGGMPGFAGGGGAAAPNPSPPGPPIPPTVQPAAQSNPVAAATGATNSMMPAPLQQILSVLMAGSPSGGQ
jgi:hypothetical protein